MIGPSAPDPSHGAGRAGRAGRALTNHSMVGRRPRPASPFRGVCRSFLLQAENGRFCHFRPKMGDFAIFGRKWAILPFSGATVNAAVNRGVPQKPADFGADFGALRPVSQTRPFSPRIGEKAPFHRF